MKRNRLDLEPYCKLSKGAFTTYQSMKVVLDNKSEKYLHNIVCIVHSSMKESDTQHKREYNVENGNMNKINLHMYLNNESSSIFQEGYQYHDRNLEDSVGFNGRNAVSITTKIIIYGVK